MIISHKYKFIFLKTKKTAGSSIEVGLSRFCGPDDILTSMGPKDEKVRREMGYVGEQNSLVPLKAYYRWEWRNLLLKFQRSRYFNHMPAERVKRCLPSSIWDNYYKFCFERNPWDKVASLYYYVNREQPRPYMSEFIESEAVQSLVSSSGFGFYSDENQICVDRVFKFEDLNSSLLEIQRTLDLPDRIELPRLKSEFRKDKKSYRELYTDKDREEIAHLFSREITAFNYEF